MLKGCRLADGRLERVTRWRKERLAVEVDGCSRHDPIHGRRELVVMAVAVVVAVVVVVAVAAVVVSLPLLLLRLVLS